MDLHKLQVVIEANIQGLKKGTEKAKAEVNKFKNDVDKQLKNLGDETTGLDGLKKAINDTAKQSVAPLKKVASLIDKIAKSRAKPKIETDQFRKIREATEMARIDMQQLAMQLANTPKVIQNAEYAKLANEMDDLSSASGKARAHLKKVQEAYDKAGPSGKEKLAEPLRLATNACNALDRKLSAVNAKMEAMSGNANVANPAYQKLALKYGSKQASVASGERKMAGMIANGQRYEKQATIFTRLGNAVSKLSGIFKKGSKTSNDFSRGMRTTYGVGGPLSRMLRTLAISARFMIASMIFTGAINSMKQGFTDLAAYSSSTQSALSSLKSSLIQLRGSFAAAFAPILTYVAPVLNYLIELIASAMTAIAKFFAYLTGQSTVTVAIPATKSFNAAGDAASGANDSAKELQKTLMGFDQINKLEDATSGSSGGSGGSGSGSDSSAFTTIDVGTNDFAKLIKDSWEKADFTEVGTIVADKLNNALESINWDNIKTKCEKIAKSIGTFINGFVTEFDWKLLAESVSEGIKTAMDGVSTLLKTINWQEIGKAIVDFICGIDFEGLIKSSAKLLGSIAGGLAGIIAGAIEELGTKIGGEFKQSIEDCGGNIVLGILEGLGNALYKIGEWIVNFFDYFVQGFKDAFGIASPAKKMNETGENIILGIKEGFENKVQDLIDWIKALPAKLLGAVNDKITIGIELVKSGWESLKDWVGEKVSVGVGLAKSGWQSLKEWIGDSVKIEINLKKGWSNLKKALGLDEGIKLKFTLPKIKVKWSSKKVAGFTIKYPSGFSTYAKGGFPEEGPFWMNRGEVAGKFSNGKSVVANNQQITDGIANAVGPAVYSAMVSAMSGSNGGNVTIKLEGDAKKLFKVMQTEANNYMQSTGQMAFNM